MDDCAQVSTEYLLLIAVGLAVILAAIGLTLQLRNLGDLVSARMRQDRNSTLALISR
ncbi:MAG: hypothetical protein AABW54_02895 [Candidatus Micrarchaeota archaeon]